VTTILGHESDGSCELGSMPCVRFAFALFLCLTSSAAAQQQPQHNPYTNWYEYAPKGATPQYNPYTKKREYAPEGATPRYNPYTKQRELVGPD
jgi:hypothetical protein